MQIDKNKMLDVFHELYSIEVKARDYYAKLLEQEITKKDRSVIMSIYKDEKQHMKIAQTIIKIVSNDRHIK